MATSLAPTIQASAAAEAARLWERHRRWLVHLTFVIYWLIILEGVLRKWMFPSYSRYFYFIRDPFVLLLYLLAIKAQVWPRKSLLLTFGTLLSLACLVLIVVQARLSEDPFSWLVAGVGWRLYFFLLPLPFLIARFFRREDFARLVRQTLLFSIPVAVLIYAQYKSPSSALINGGKAVVGEDQLGSQDFMNGRAVRTAGTFSTPLGQSVFSTSLVAMLLGTWLVRPSRRPIRGIALLLATASAMICVFLSGSRGTLVAAGLSLSIVAVSLLFIGRQKLFVQCLIVLAALAPACLWTASLILPEAMENTISHWQNAGATEELRFGSWGIFSRALFGFYGFAYLIPQTPAMGFGMGLATNAAAPLTSSARRNRGATEFTAVWLPTREQMDGLETGLGRNIVDLGPVFGLLYIGFRLAFTFWMAAQALGAARRTGDITPVAIFSFVGYSMGFGAITASGPVNAYCWVFAGFTLAAARFARSASAAPNAVAVATPETRFRSVRPPSRSMVSVESGNGIMPRRAAAIRRRHV